MAKILNLDALRQAPVETAPFVFAVVSNFLSPHIQQTLQCDFPKIEQPGSFPIAVLNYGPSFAALLDELRSKAFEQVIAEKFAMDLSDYPLLVTVRGRCHKRDGRVHTDSVWKLVTVLIYLNEPWQSKGGHLRLLRSGDIEDAVTEVPPEFGNLLVFKRSDCSFHGHKPFEGERRLVQLNWVTSQDKIDREVARHRRTAWAKRLFPFLFNWGY